MAFWRELCEEMIPGAKAINEFKDARRIVRESTSRSRIYCPICKEYTEHLGLSNQEMVKRYRNGFYPPSVLGRIAKLLKTPGDYLAGHIACTIDAPLSSLTASGVSYLECCQCGEIRRLEDVR